MTEIFPHLSRKCWNHANFLAQIFFLLSLVFIFVQFLLYKGKGRV